MAISPTEIIFSSEQQQALLGHAVSDKKVYETCSLMGVTSSWFYNANHQSIWAAMDEFAKVHKRSPTVSELKATSTFKNDEQKVLLAREKSLNTALEAKREIDFDSIVLELREWAKGQAFVRGMETAADFYKRKDVVSAYKVVGEMNREVDLIDKIGLEARCLDAPTRAEKERAERVEQKDKTMKFGVSFLDDATGGIGVSDVVLIGAKTGVGKTQLVTKIAAYNARNKKRVTLFALEAEPNEIERRIKYAMLVTRFKQQNPESKVAFNYRDWRRGAFLDELTPHEAFVDGIIRARYTNLRTVYKGWGDYSINELERDIMRMSRDTDLFIIDHLHYIDTEGEDQNHEMKRIVKVLRDLALVLGKPIIIVAHMRKTMGGRKSTPLVPDLEDFHGSSDVIKIATTAVIIAPCYPGLQELFTAIPKMFYEDKERISRVWATFMRVAKCRLDGSITRYCGICFYDDALGEYRQEYGVGRLKSGDMTWEPEEHRPYWATHGVLTLNPVE